MSCRTSTIMAFTLGLVVAFAPRASRAQAYLHLHEPGESIRIIPHPPHPPHPPLPPHRPRPAPLQPAVLTNLEVEVAIEDLVARVMLDQSFRNPNHRQVEGTYLLPLPRDAAVRDMSLFIDGEPVECEVIEADKARSLYEDVVRRARDPALLEYVGHDVVRLRIFPFEPGQVRRVRFSYSQVLRRDFGMTEFRLPLGARGSRGDNTIENLLIQGTVAARQPLTNLYAPNHDVEFVRRGDDRAEFSLEADDYAPGKDLLLYFATSDKDLGAGLLTCRDGDEPGWFLLTLAPRPGAAKSGEAIPKDVTFVFDTSGSMQGEKIEQARGALVFCLRSLAAQDRFRVVRFSTEAENFRDEMVEATPENVEAAVEFVKGFKAHGGTAILDALNEALEVPAESARPHMVVFLTDGKPTVGETDTDAILASVGDGNKDNARVFVFGVGYKVNTLLLDRLADENGGTPDYVTPEEDIEVKVSNFFTRISEPILTDLEIDYGDVRVSKVYPSRLPDVFAGSQITLLGRYENPDRTTLVLRGKERGREEVFEYPVEFPAKSEQGDFVPRLWAIRRVAHLVQEIRKNGESDELREEITALGKEYAIATPYTSLLVLEDEAARRPVRRVSEAPPRGWGFRGLPQSAAPEMEMGTAPTGDALSLHDAYGVTSGREAVQTSRRLVQMREATRVSDAERLDEAPVRRVAGRTFQQIDGVWTQTGYEEGFETETVVCGSDEYFDLLGLGEEVGAILALGRDVVFEVDATWYRVTGEGGEE